MTQPLFCPPVKSKNIILKGSFLFLFFITGNNVKSQISTSQTAGQNLNTITTAVPFVLITPDSRAGGMGDVGSATNPDVNSIFWNCAKLAFVEKSTGVGINYTPWLRNIVPDVSLSYLSFYKRLDNYQTLGASLRYFTLGEINFTGQNGEPLGNAKPNEFSVDVAYSRKLSDYLGVGVTLRYIFSNLALNIGQENQFKPGQSVAGDLGFYYNKPILIGGKESKIALGMSLSNMGNKMAYSESGNTSFIPTNLRLGSTLTYNYDKYNSISFSVDFNKLLVPTNPIYVKDSVTGQTRILRGLDPNKKSVMEGILGSFSDAPDGFAEELREINPSIGLEYLYNSVFALRAGYMYEHPSKGGRHYFTSGIGLKYSVFNLDFSYLIPVGMLQTNPLANTLRFSLLFDLTEIKKTEETPPIN